MKQKNFSDTAAFQTQSSGSSRQEIDSHPHGGVRRRSFLKGLGIVGATLLPTSALLMTNAKAQGSSGKLSKGDADILRFLAWAELVEVDLWTQYNELGGAQLPDETNTSNAGNGPYKAALQNLDGDMPQYITDNTQDEITHAAFLNAYLTAHGAQPVVFPKAFFRSTGSSASGADQTKINTRLTTLLHLDVNTSYYTRYRSNENPDLGATFTGPVTINDKKGIPQFSPGDEAPPDHIQAIANTAAFHFAFIESGGSSLYPTLALKVTNLEVLRIVLSIGGTEIDHFSLWHDKLSGAVTAVSSGGFAVTDSVTGLKFPDLSTHPTELTQINKILAEPCDFLSESLPEVSVIRPTSTKNSGAMAAFNAFKADGLFHDQKDDFLDFGMQLAEAADNAQRESD
jgi:Ferritin-like domain